MAISTSGLTRQARRLVRLVSPDVDESVAVQYAVRELKSDTKGGTRKEWSDIQMAVEGLARTARVKVQDDMADALDRVLAALNRHRRDGAGGWEGEMPIKMGNLPDHIQLLLNLSSQPATETQDFAHAFLHRPTVPGPTPDQILYQQIMSEPFEGDHWGEGFDEEATEDLTDSESSSSGGDGDEQVVTPSTGRGGKVVARRWEVEQDQQAAFQQAAEERLGLAKQELRMFRDKAYWRQRSMDIPDTPEGVYGWQSCITEVSAIQLNQSAQLQAKKPCSPISARDLQREILFAMSGRGGVIFKFDSVGECSVRKEDFQVPQFTPMSLRAILEFFAGRATQAASIRAFNMSASASSSTSQSHPQRTKQAFAEACRNAMTDLEQWVSDCETAFIRGVDHSNEDERAAISTPLSLRLDLQSRLGDLLEYLNSFMTSADMPVQLLNTIYASLLNLPVSLEALQEPLKRLFIATAEPMWQSLGHWLLQGMPIPSSLTSQADYHAADLDDERALDPDFCIVRDRDVSWTDEDFWEAGFVSSPEGWPKWLGEDIEETVLEGGKARGLLKAFDDLTDPLQSWTPLYQLLSPSMDSIKPRDISQKISDYLAPMCSMASFQLRRVLNEDCGLEAHLDAIDALLFMGGYSAMSDWQNWLFQRMKSRKRWSDRHILTTALRESIEQTDSMWMNGNAIRITVKRTKMTETPIKSLANVSATYEVPFPLSQLFTLTSIEVRSEVFTFLLQLQYGKWILTQSRLFDADFLANCQPTVEIKRLWLVRQQLSWFISTIYTWLTERVIEIQCDEHKKNIANMTSLKSMISAELQHARSIRETSFLHARYDDMHEVLMSMLELATELHKTYSAYLSNGELHPNGRVGPPRPSNRKVAGSLDSEDDTDVEDMEMDEALDSDSLSFGERVRKMQLELDEGVQRFVQGIGSLANSNSEEDTNECRTAWTILAFALEDWNTRMTT